MIRNRPELSGTVFSLSEAVSWFEGAMAALDCYSWVLKEQFLSPSELFGRECTHTHTHTHTYIRTYIHIPVLIVHRVNYYIIGGGVKERH